MNVALQMYTVRDEAEKDFLGTLEKVAEIGYTGVEFAGFGNVSASELKNCMDRLGLKAIGSHTGIDILKNDLEGAIEYNLEIGNSNIIIPWAGYKSRQDYIDMASFCNEIGEKCRKIGMQLHYHNHAAEFEKFNDIYGLDILYSETDKELLKAEVDTFWVKYAGVNPVDYIKKYSGRCELLHLKDMMDDTEKTNCEIGNGIMDFNTIIKVAKEISVKHFIVEQDSCNKPSLESVKISFENLKRLNIL